MQAIESGSGTETDTSFDRMYFWFKPQKNCTYLFTDIQDGQKLSQCIWSFWWSCVAQLL